MSVARLSRLSWLVFGAVAIVAIAFGRLASAQSTPRINAGNVQISGVPEDWSSHHVVFSDPGTEQTAIRAGRYQKWLKTVNDPRYVMQQLRRNGAVRGPLADDAAYVQHLKAELGRATPLVPATPFRPGAPRNLATPIKPISPVGRLGNPNPILGRRPIINPSSKLKSDWSVPLSNVAVMPDTFPAKYSFNPIGAPNCMTDFVAYPTGATGTTTLATIIAFNEIYPGGSGCITVPSVYWAYNTTIAGTAPGSVTTSPVLSTDGTKIAYVQSNGTVANLIILKTNPASGESMTTPVSITSPSANMSCTAPCMTVTPLNNNTPNADTYSSPYYDYANDALYVGDDNGDLYKITPVFNTPATSPAATASQGPFFHAMASPVYDPISGCVFVGDTAGIIYQFNSGIPGTVCTSSTFGWDPLNSRRTPELTTRTDGGFHDGLLLDPVAGEIYGFLASAETLTQCNGGAASSINCVVQYPTNFANLAAPSGAQVLGDLSTFGEVLYSGTFDNVYYNSTDPASPSGNIWVIGNLNQYEAANLYQIPITSNVLGAPVPTTVGFKGGTLGNPPYTPNFASAITEFCNNGGDPCVSSGSATTSGTDSIYFSINQGLSSTCHSTSGGAGCVVAYNVNNPAAPTLTGEADYAFAGVDTVNGSAVIGCWGTSAIVIDNDSPSPGASEIYYMYFGGNDPSPGDPNSVCGTSSGGTAAAIQTLQGTL